MIYQCLCPKVEACANRLKLLKSCHDLLFENSWQNFIHSKSRYILLAESPIWIPILVHKLVKISLDCMLYQPIYLFIPSFKRHFHYAFLKKRMTNCRMTYINLMDLLAVFETPKKSLPYCTFFCLSTP